MAFGSYAQENEVVEEETLASWIERSRVCAVAIVPVELSFDISCNGEQTRHYSFEDQGVLLDFRITGIQAISKSHLIFYENRMLLEGCSVNGNVIICNYARPLESP